MLLLPTALLLAAALSALAQAPSGEVFPLRAGTDSDHRWTEYYSSDRFTVWYSSNPAEEANITEAAARSALGELERIFDVYVYENGFRHPYASYTDAQKFKIGAYVLRNGSKYSEGWAFGGTTGNPRGPGMWLDARAAGDKWALAHEFMHGLQGMTGGLAGSDFTGWFHECHANLMPHRVYPTEVHYCAEMYTRMPELYLGSTRNRYCNWHFFEYLIDKKGIAFVNDLWSKSYTSGANQRNADVFSEMTRIHGISQKEFGDIFGDFAMRAVIWDMERGPVLRGAFNASSVNERLKRPRYTYLEALDGTDGQNGRFVSPFAVSPQRYAFNIVRLYPDESRSVTVRFRGDVQQKNNIPNYRKDSRYPLEPDEILDPGSDWRYGLVAVTGGAGSTGANVSARYSGLKRASDGNPDVSMQLQSNESELYLVVAATPTVHHKIKWDQYYYTIYRYPYMVEFAGAKPEGFQAPANPAGAPHPNGGGFVASTATVAATAYVGPNARVLERAQVSGRARIEGRAVVKGSGTQIRDSAAVRDYALVAGGEVYGGAVVAEGAKIWAGKIYGKAFAGGAANIHLGSSGGIYGSAKVAGTVWMEQNTNLNVSGTAQVLGDGEVYGVTATKGVYFGIVDAAAVADAGQGADRTEAPVEATKPRSMKWYDDGASGIGARTAVAADKMPPRFALDNRGMLRYDLGGAAWGTLTVTDSRGRVVKRLRLDGARSAVNTGLSRGTAVQALFWRVTVGGKAAGRGSWVVSG
jgi:hypothetical protein